MQPHSAEKQTRQHTSSTRHTRETQPVLCKCSHGFFLLCFCGHPAFCPVLLGFLAYCSLPPEFSPSGTRHLPPSSHVSRPPLQFSWPRSAEDRLMMQIPTPPPESPRSDIAAQKLETDGRSTRGLGQHEACSREGRSLLPGEKAATIYASTQETDTLSFKGRMQTK